MEPKDERMQDRLLSHLPKRPSNLADYRREVALLLQKNDKAFLREKWGARAIWLFCVCLGVAYMWFGNYWRWSAPNNAQFDTPRDAWSGTVACFWLIVGAVELLKHFINRGL